MTAIDAYIAAALAPAREGLETLREVLRRRILTGIEAFRYGMPTATLAARAARAEASAETAPDPELAS